MQNEIGSTLTQPTYSINYKIQGNQIKSQQTVLNDAMFQFITSASSVKNSTLDSFSQTSSANSTDQNFYFVASNGIDSLRIGSESESSQFYQYYTEQIKDQKLKFLIMMACGLGVMAIGVLLILPIVFSVQKTTNKVLSLFGYIPVDDIRVLAMKCEDFMIDHLGETRTERKSEESDDHDQRSEEPAISVSKSHQSPFSHHSPDKLRSPESNEHYSPSNDRYSPRNAVRPDASMLNHANVSVRIEEEESAKKLRPLKIGSDGFAEIVTGNESPDVKKSLGFQTNSPTNSKTQQQQQDNASALGNSMGQSGIRLLEDHTMKAVNSTEAANGLMTQAVEPKKEEPKKEEAKPPAELPSPQDENEEENALQTDRSKKLLNSSGGNRWTVIIQFLFFTLAFMSYYGIDYAVENHFVETVITLYQVMQLLSQRPAFFKYVNVFTQEEIATAQVVMINSKFIFSKRQRKVTLTYL